MPCVSCICWMVSDETERTPDGIPHFGRCVARPPEPQIFAVEDRDKWNRSEMAVCWPQTLASDHCMAHVDRALIDPVTGRWKSAMPSPVDEDDNEIVN